MRLTLLASASLLCLTAAACSNDPPSMSGTAGTTGAQGTAGTRGTAGSSSTPGAAGTGNIAGSSGTAGTNGSAGTTGDNSGTAGSSTGGSSTGGTSSVGSGGSATAGTGGSGTGGSTTGGSSGGTAAAGTSGGGTTGAAGAGDLLSIVGDWDGSLNLFPCADKRSGYDCSNVKCTNGTHTQTNSWKIGGTPGTVYDVKFNVRGVVEAYAYVGGTRVSGTDSIAKGDSLFISGGEQQPSGNGNDYNTYELDVTPPVAGVTNKYYLNSVIASENPHTSSQTQHLTFPINYDASIKVTGGGTVTFTSYDSNCALVQNCGPTHGNMCTAPRTVSTAGTMPQPPASFVQPYQAPVGSYAQWVYFDVTSVTAQ